MDWHQLWEIISAPDNVPIVGLIPLLGFYIYLAWRQAHANDQLAGIIDLGDAPSCSFCGSIMTRNGSCYRCMSCGSTSGCS